MIDNIAGAALDSENEGQRHLDRGCDPRLPAHFGVIGPHATADETAAYYMYHYKIILCTKDHSHDWGACPYAHEKENARRRDPSKFNYSSCICPNAKKPEGCPNGVACPYAHTLFEYWLHPQRFRTQMCRSGAKCQRSLCFFAHSAAELRSPGSTREQNIVLPLAVTAAPPAAAGNMPGLSALQVQHLIDESSHNLVPLPPAVEDSGSSYGSQAGRMLLPPVLSSVSGSGSTTASDTDVAGPIMLLPAQQQQVLPSAALLIRLQQQQELQSRQARFMELQLQLKQQQDSMRTALLQAELQQQHQLAALSLPLQGSGSVVTLGGPTSCTGMTLGSTLLPSIPMNMMPAAVTAGTSPCILPIGQLATLSSCQSMLTAATPLAGMSNLGLSDGHIVSVSGATGLGSSNIMPLTSEPALAGYLDVNHGHHVQSWF